MSHLFFSRRDVLKQIGLAGAGAIIAPAVIRGQNSPIRIAGMPVEIAVASVSATTVRITAAGIAGAAGVPDDGALVRAADAKPLGRVRASDSFKPIKAGNLVVRFTADPPTIHVDDQKGTPIQKLTLSPDKPGVSFLLPKGPLLGLGEGGPQFDRKGSVDRMRNGQGGYQLRTHGGRVPIQWLLGTDGWGMFIHQPLGTFDFSGGEGALTPFADALPLDVFVAASSDPKVLMAEYGRITGYAELPPLWSFGYMQSHRTLAGPDEVMRVAKTFREKKLPCEALIYLGTEFTPSGWNTRNGEFGWKKENFPEPQKAVDELHALNY
jgi:alpha-glucosidase (family GH31 glycosyl hydrolase)